MNLPLVQIICADTINPQPVRWLWPGWLARGKLHVLAGAPGTGKTTIALDLMSCITSGKPFPSGYRPPRGSVLIWSGEDDSEDTLTPRLIASGADRSRVHFVGDVKHAGDIRAFDPARDAQSLAIAAAKIPDLTLILIDPLVSAVSGDSHKNAEVRRGLQPLVELASGRDAALIGITHLSKGTQGRDPLERLTGSVAFGALARVVFGTARQEVEHGEPQRFAFARVKSNIGPDDGGFAYEIEQVDLTEHPDISTNRIVWVESLAGSARQLLAEPVEDIEHSEARDAVSYLHELLSAGPKAVKEVRQAGDEAGFAWRTLQRAMRAAGVESRRGGFGMPATWQIPIRAIKQPVAPLAPSNGYGAGSMNAAARGKFEARAETGHECTAEEHRRAHG